MYTRGPWNTGAWTSRGAMKRPCTENGRPRFDYSAEHLRKAGETVEQWIRRLKNLASKSAFSQ